MSTIATIITCYNRRQLTIRCLDHLFKLNNNVDVYLVDDDSTDGTSKAIQQKFPQVNIIHGNGDLFWNRGMHTAWEHASKKDYDYYLWLNDDVILYNNCFVELLSADKIANSEAIISGAVESHDKSSIIYGGSDQTKRLIVPNGNLQEIKKLNGNIVLIPKFVFKQLGNLDSKFHHDLGDVDYGFRAIEKGIKVYLTENVVASGEANSFCRVRLQNSTLLKRLKKLYSPMGSNPNINFYFRRRHFGYINAIFYYIFLHIINLLPDNIIRFIFKDRYIYK